MATKLKGIVNNGIDIGSSFVKAVKLFVHQDGAELLGFGGSQIKNATSREAVVDCIKKVAAEALIDEKFVNISVLGSNVIVRYIILPKMTKEELKNAIRFEAEKYVPFNMDEVVLDYQIFEDNLENNKMRVLLVVAKKDYIENRLKLIEEAGFGVRLIDVDSFALANAFFRNFPGLDKDKTVALINVGGKFTDINILKGDLSYFTRTIELGGDDITRAIGTKLNLGYQDADSMKLKLSLDKEAELFEIMKGVLNNLTDEIKLSFGYYENQFGKDIDEVYLSGGTIKLVGLKDFFAKSFGFEFKLWDPVQFLKISDTIDKNKLDLLKSELGVAIGLAIR